jgi:DNA-binding response OmpR family regulator
VKVLVLEDEQKVARFIVRILTEEGLAADLCATGADAAARAETGAYDLVVLDWTVPESDGITVCRDLRGAGCTLPVLMFAARGEAHDRVLALEAGADDCMVKPFEIDEVLARVRALLRRKSGFAAVRCGEIEIDRVARQAKVRGRAMSLTNREYALLLHLVHRTDRIVRRSELLSQVWGLRFDPGSNLIDVHVSRLRDKLGEHAWMIETVRGVGYRLRGRRAA